MLAHLRDTTLQVNHYANRYLRKMQAAGPWSTILPCHTLGAELHSSQRRLTPQPVTFPKWVGRLKLLYAVTRIFDIYAFPNISPSDDRSEAPAFQVVLAGRDALG